MSKFTKTLAVGLLAVSAVAHADWSDDFFGAPYVGIDYKYRRIRGNSDWNKVLPKSFHAPEVYLGLRFNENFALQLGYEQSAKKSKATTLPNAPFLGVDTGAAINTTAKVKFRGYNVDLKGFLPLDQEWSLVGTVGMSRLTSSLDGTATAATGPVDEFLSGRFKSTKWLPRVKAGVEYLADACWGVNALVGWEQTSKLRFDKAITTAAYANVSDAKKPFRDSMTFNLGVFYKF